jgi:hypothetical protein
MHTAVGFMEDLAVLCLAASASFVVIRWIFTESEPHVHVHSVGDYPMHMDRERVWAFCECGDVTLVEAKKEGQP